ncbi:hypothetical protein ACIBI9_57965 [Nonomuraea sp. NPDC050451]|uniref:hypothetical protein n=1 Tax=Nonomuraea sp. NPDC050451 TaxID=3364364 RepID=UPI0037B51654
MRNKIMRVLVPAAALAVAAAVGASTSASAQAGYIKSVHRTLAQCEAAGWKYSGDHEYWDCDWDSPFWALWVLK